MWRLLKREDDNYGVQDDIDKPLCREFLTLRQTLDWIFIFTQELWNFILFDSDFKKISSLGDLIFHLPDVTTLPISELSVFMGSILGGRGSYVVLSTKSPLSYCTEGAGTWR